VITDVPHLVICDVQAWYLRHSVIFYNLFWFIAERKTHVHVVSFIQTDAPEHIRPDRQPLVFLQQYIIGRLSFPFRMLFDKLSNSN
jgi:hypothetical protein